MKKLLIAAAMLLSLPAFADGFTCQATDGSLNVKAFNHTDSDEGTRNAAVLVLSNPAADGARTAARFTDVQGTLNNSGAFYQAKVDLRHTNDLNKGAMIANIVALDNLSMVALDVDFSYAAPVAANSSVAGTLILYTRDNNVMKIDLNCARYLKNN